MPVAEDQPGLELEWSREQGAAKCLKSSTAQQDPAQEPGTASGHSNGWQREWLTPSSRTPQQDSSERRSVGEWEPGAASARNNRTGDKSSPT
ncbi:hypothetical protein NDU88_009513 [Pleurodeles waltl]|uniref:Uncharacterized protein n=1 Tax=Pleurodeles waltl TaxID=8319 RepID=A0AAV7P2M2_PLEWA|nr:hypothetical protein NDU88_009513 [Pleurodeles waltl]